MARDKRKREIEARKTRTKAVVDKALLGYGFTQQESERLVEYLWNEGLTVIPRGKPHENMELPEGFRVRATTTIKELRPYLGERVALCLHHNDIETVGQAWVLRDEKFLRMPNFGKKSLADLRKVIGPGHWT